jgi:hypothetical protein
MRSQVMLGSKTNRGRKNPQPESAMKSVGIIFDLNKY